MFTPRTRKHASSFTPDESIHVLYTCIDSHSLAPSAPHGGHEASHAQDTSTPHPYRSWHRDLHHWQAWRPSAAAASEAHLPTCDRRGHLALRFLSRFPGQSGDGPGCAQWPGGSGVNWLGSWPCILRNCFLVWSRCSADGHSLGEKGKAGDEALDAGLRRSSGVDAGEEGLPKSGWSTPSSLKASPACFPSAVGLCVLSSAFDAARVTMLLLSRFSRLSLSAGATARPEDPRSDKDVVMGRLPSLVETDGCCCIGDATSEQSNGV